MLLNIYPEFVYSHQFSSELDSLEPHPFKQDRLIDQIERQCRKQIMQGVTGHAVVRALWKGDPLLVWFHASNAEHAEMLSIRREAAVLLQAA